MTDIVEQEEIVPTPVAEPEVDTSNLSDEEVQAASKGWTPDKDAYEAAHPTKKWKSAEAFLDAEEMIGSIMELKRELREQAKVFRELVVHNQRLAEMQKAQRLAALEARQLEAVVVGDTEAFKAAKEAYHKTEQEPTQILPPPPKSKEQIEEIKTFTERNKGWCNNSTTENTRMMEAADKVYDLMLTEFPGKPHTEILTLTENKVKELFSHRFVNEKRTAAAVTTSAAPVPTKTKHGWRYEDLNRTQKLVCDAMEKAGKTKAFYLDQLAGIYGPK